MTSSELEEWLKGEQSEGSGWSKDDGSGETIGHERWVLDTSLGPVLNYGWLDS